MRRFLFSLSVFCVLVTACQSDKTAPVPTVTPAPVASSSSVPPSPSPSPSPTPILAAPSPSPSPKVRLQVKTIDGYLLWFLHFAQNRASANTTINRRTEQIAAHDANTAQTIPGMPSPPAGGLLSLPLKQSLEETVALNKQIAQDFVQERPPAECAELARLYATVLNKSLTVMDAKLWKIEYGARANVPNGTPDAEHRLDLSTSVEVRDDLAQVNAEIGRLYKKHPELKTPRLILTQ